MKSEKKRIIHALFKYVFELHRFEREETRKIIQKLDKMTQAIAGSYADTLRKEAKYEGKIEGKIEANTLNHIKFLCFIFKKMPHLSDVEAAHSAGSSLEMAVDLRKLLNKYTVKTAGKMILKTWFVEMELNEEDKANLLQYVRNYYKKEK